jgi:hypothetical protein
VRSNFEPFRFTPKTLTNFHQLKTYKFPNPITCSHRIDITRNYCGEFNISFDSNLVIQAIDNNFITSEKMSLGSFIGDSGIDNITVVDLQPDPVTVTKIETTTVVSTDTTTIVSVTTATEIAVQAETITNATTEFIPTTDLITVVETTSVVASITTIESEDAPGFEYVISLMTFASLGVIIFVRRHKV